MAVRVFVLTLFICAATLYSQEADLILHHGKIITADPQFHIMDAIAIPGDRIVAIGRRNDVTKLAGPNTRQIDLKGKTVLPGLIDSHVHADDASIYEFDHPVPEMETIADALKYIHSRAAVTKEGTGSSCRRSISRACVISASPLGPSWMRRRPETQSTSKRARTHP
jgi:hypothetical protein